MIIVGFDPSFVCAGVSIMDTVSKKIWITDVRENIGKVKNFDNVVRASLRIHKHIRDIFDYLEIEPDIILSEKPFPMGQYAPGLFALDSTLFIDLIFRYKSLKEVYLMSARFLTHVHKKNGIEKYKKSDSTSLVRNNLLPVFERAGYNYDYGSFFNDKKEFKGGINNNSAESFIMLSRLFVRLNIDKNNELMDGLFEIGEGLFTEMENKFFTRSNIIEGV